MKGKLNLKETSFEDLENIIGDRFFRYTKQLKLKEELPDELKKLAEINYQSGFIDCFSWLREKGIIKVKL